MSMCYIYALDRLCNIIRQWLTGSTFRFGVSVKNFILDCKQKRTTTNSPTLRAVSCKQPVHCILVYPYFAVPCHPARSAKDLLLSMQWCRFLARYLSPSINLPTQ